MKQTTKDWLSLAEDELLAAKKLAGNERLTNLVSFHCQQNIDTRYQGDLGLLPNGKPTSEIEPFIQLCETVFNRLKDKLG